ncbi:MAG: hypothetical protein WC696_05385 [Candidatus Methylopumilus sp.]
MQVLRLLIAISVAVALGICKPAGAESNGPVPHEVVEPAVTATSHKASLLEGFELGGYSSAGLNIHPGGEKDAALNEVSLILRWEGESRLRFFGELELEHPLTWNQDARFTSHGSKVDLERLYFDYNLSEQVNVRAGRFLTPAGRWNLLHAAPLVWTSTRPLATSRLFPISTNGAMVYGAAPLGDKAFEYTFFVEALKDQDEDRNEIQFRDARGARFVLSGKVNLGVSLLEFTEKSPMNDRFRMIGLDFLTQHNGWELSGEAFQRFYSNGNEGGNGAYLQGVAPIGDHGAGNGWFAIARLEGFKRPAEGSSDRWLLGTAWRMSPSKILKLEYAGGDEERVDSPKGFLASFAILF